MNIERTPERRQERGGDTFAEIRENMRIKFEKYAEENPGIEGDFSGDPAEILRHPKEERREALNEHISNTEIRRKAITACRLDIEEIIENNYSVSKEDLRAVVDRYADEYAFSERQKSVIDSVIDRCYEMRERMLAVRKRFPDDIDLVNELTGFNFSEDDRDMIIVFSGFMSIDIMTNKENIQKVCKHMSGDDGIGVGGFAYEYRHGSDESVYFTFINSQVNDRDRIIYHEREHIKHKTLAYVLKRHFDVMTYDKWFGSDRRAEEVVECYEGVKEHSKDLALNILRMQMGETRRAFFEMFRDEIFATTKSHGIPYLLNNYLPLARARHRYFPSEMMEKLNDSLQDDEDAMKIINEHSEDKYYDRVEEAARLFVDLVEKDHHTEQQAAALLADIPLWRWKKMTKRWKEMKGREKKSTG